MINQLWNSIKEFANIHPYWSAVFVAVIILTIYLKIRKHLFYEHIICNVLTDEVTIRRAEVYLHKSKKQGYYKLDKGWVDLKSHQIKEIEDTRPRNHPHKAKYKDGVVGQFRLYEVYQGKEFEMKRKLKAV
mgnify:FL=1